MSLVNEMLNELQKEQQSPANFGGLVAQENGSLFSTHLSSLLVLTLVLLSGVSVWYFWSNVDSAEISSIGSSSAMPEPQIIESTFSRDNNKPTGLKTTENEGKKSSLKTVNEESIDSNIVEVKNRNDLNLEKQTTIQQTPSKFGIASTSKPTPQSKPTRTTVLPTQPEEPMIKISRRSQANKDLSNIVNQWKQHDQISNKRRIADLLSEYKIQSEVWLKTVSFLQRKNPSLYQEYLEKALVRFPEQDAFNMLRVKQLMKENKFTESLSYLEKTSKSGWELTQYRIAGYLSQKTNHHQKAIGYYNHLLLTNPNLGDVNMAIAISLEALNENKLAILKFQRALEDNKLNDLQRKFITQRIAAIQG